MYCQDLFFYHINSVQKHIQQLIVSVVTHILACHY